MPMKGMFLFIGLLLSLRAFSSHIVGGEIVLKHLEGENYELGLILYFDRIHGSPGLLDDPIEVHIFDQAQHKHLRSFRLPIVSDTPVKYTNPDCAKGNLLTQRIYYAQQISLPASDYNDPQGYYFVYERCCRNRIIGNINKPNHSGQAFYLKIPPVVKNGVPFINSSPHLFPPLNDYACVGRPFYFNFGGVDTDGDSLVYRLSTPLIGNSTPFDPVPSPRAAPYPKAVFLPPYTLNKMVKGSPPLAINPKTGMIRLTPSEVGLYVFAIICEEYRAGKKIGVLRRDFQMLVLDCPPASFPRAGTAVKNSTIVGKKAQITVDALKKGNCFRIYATDADSGSVLRPRLVPLTHPDAPMVSIKPETQKITASAQTVSFEICINDCPPVVNQTYEFLTIINDNSCSLPLSDTLRLAVKATVDNNPPKLSIDLPYNAPKKYYEANVEIGTLLEFTLTATDADNDSLKMRSLHKIKGLNFEPLSGRGRMQKKISWRPTCDLLPPGDTAATYLVSFAAEDYWKCGKKEADTAKIKLNLFYSPQKNQVPKLEITSLRPVSAKPKQYAESLLVGDSLLIDLQITDPEGDYIFATVAEGAELLSDRSAKNRYEGLSPLRLSFVFRTACAMLGANAAAKTYRIVFSAKDGRNCAPNAKDSLSLNITINDLPQITIGKFPNAFSPNQDGIGDAFKIEKLPIDNCKDRFESVTIYNRWSEKVFESRSRHFAWEGKNQPAGIYFYFIKYKNSSYKGTITLLSGK